MVVAVVGACAKVARCSLVAREAMASSVVAVTLVIAVSGASQQRAIKAGETLLTVAGHVECANTVSRAVVGADTSLALNS